MGFPSIEKDPFGPVRTSVTVTDGITEVGGARLKARWHEGCYIHSLTHVTSGLVRLSYSHSVSLNLKIFLVFKFI
jgi:hypothetical protein